MYYYTFEIGQKYTMISEKAHGRMQLLHGTSQFTKTKNDLRGIYLTYIRPVLEQSATVWHSSLIKKMQQICEVCIKNNNWLGLL